jgi:hypothetical protein
VRRRVQVQELFQAMSGDIHACLDVNDLKWHDIFPNVHSAYQLPETRRIFVPSPDFSRLSEGGSSALPTVRRMLGRSRCRHPRHRKAIMPRGEVQSSTFFISDP